MHLSHLFAIAVPLLLLTGCGGGAAPASSSSSASVADTAPQAADNPSPASSASSTAAPVLANSAPAGPPAAADKLQPLYGTWGLDPDNCGDQVLKISKTRFDGPGSSCSIAGFTDNGDGSYTASMSCNAGGQTSSEKVSMRPIFAPTGEGIDLIYLNRQNLASEVLRCNTGSD